MEKKNKRRNQVDLAFSMIEVMISVAILGVLAVALIANYNLQLMRARDARRKDDLEKIKVVFENYYNDNECYPPANTFLADGETNPENTDSTKCVGSSPTGLRPYINALPCDPLTKKPYAYYPPEGTTDVCTGYRLYAKLEDSKDPSIIRAGCYLTRCGQTNSLAPYINHNYGIAMGARIPQLGFVPGGPAPTAGPSPTPVVPAGNVEVCNTGQCQMASPAFFIHFVSSHCPVYWYGGSCVVNPGFPGGDCSASNATCVSCTFTAGGWVCPPNANCFPPGYPTQNPQVQCQ